MDAVLFFRKDMVGMMENLTLSELLAWLEMSEETGHYRGYSRHAIALAYNKRIKQEFKLLYLESITK